MGLHYGCSLVAASLKGLQDVSSYQVVQTEAYYSTVTKACKDDPRDLPPPPSDKACVQPATTLTAPLFAEVAKWTANVSCWGEFDVYGRQLRAMQPPGDLIFSYKTTGKGYFGGVTYCGIYADGDNKGAVKCFGRSFPLDTRVLTVAQQADLSLVGCSKRTLAVLGLKQYVFRNVQVGGSFACGMAFDTSLPDASSYDQNKPESWPYELMCWGDDSSAQCSVPPSPTDYGSPFTVRYIDYSLGFDHACALRNDNRIVCWGNNIDGQASVPNTDATLSKQLGVGLYVSADKDWISVSAGWAHTCGLKSGGRVVCWGSNNWGQLKAPETSAVYREVSAGYDATCALSVARRIVCWGRNNRGQSAPVPLDICFQLVAVRSENMIKNILSSQRQMQFAPQRKPCVCLGSGCKCDELQLQFSSAMKAVVLSGGVWWAGCVLLLIWP